MLEASRQKQLDAMVEVEGDVSKLVDVIEAGKMAVAGWSGTASDERRLKDETGITIRIHPDGYEDHRDPITGKIGRAAIFAKSY